VRTLDSIVIVRMVRVQKGSAKPYSPLPLLLPLPVRRRRITLWPSRLRSSLELGAWLSWIWMGSATLRGHGADRDLSRKLLQVV
jgi:hypothetical protein